MCIGRAGALQLVEEFKDQWDSEPIRRIAGDICVSAVRQVRALRTYQRGLRNALERSEKAEAERKAGSEKGRAKDRGGSPSATPRKGEVKKERSPSRGKRREEEDLEEDDVYTDEEESGEAESPKVVVEKAATSAGAWKTTPKAKAGPGEERERSSSHRGVEKVHRFDRTPTAGRKRSSRERSRSRRKDEERVHRGHERRHDRRSDREEYLPPGLLKIHSARESEQWPRKRRRPRRRK